MMLVRALNEIVEPGTDAALARLGLQLEGTHRRGIDDAWNIAGIPSALFKTAWPDL